MSNMLSCKFTEFCDSKFLTLPMMACFCQTNFLSNVPFVISFSSRNVSTHLGAPSDTFGRKAEETEKCSYFQLTRILADKK